jgi:hypothetical protein
VQLGTWYTSKGSELPGISTIWKGFAAEAQVVGRTAMNSREARGRCWTFVALAAVACVAACNHQGSSPTRPTTRPVLTPEAVGAIRILQVADFPADQRETIRAVTEDLVTSGQNPS